MKRFQLLTLATAVCLGGCYGSETKQVINPYELGNEKKPLVEKPDNLPSEPAAEADRVAQTPDRGDLPSGSSPDLARNDTDASEAPSTIDPRLLAPSEPEPRSAEPIRPATPETVRPAAGESELEAPLVGPAPPPLEPQVEAVPPALAESDVPPAATEEPAASPPRPAIGDLAIDEPAPAVADIPPSLEAPEVNSVNKPPLETESPEVGTDPIDPAPQPEPEDLRPSDRLLRDRNLIQPETVAPPAEPAPTPEPAPVPAPADSPAPLGEITKVRSWVDSTGRLKIKASLDRIEGNKVHLINEKGEKLTIPMERFSKEDQEFLKGIDPQTIERLQNIGSGDYSI